MAQLTVNKIRSIGELLLQDQPVTIGRSSHNVVVLPDNLVSREHCVIEVTDGRTVLRDTGSRFGTRVNGTPVKQTVLQDGDTITIGPYEIAFVDPNTKRQVEVVEAEEVDLDESDIDLSIASAMGEHEEIERQRAALAEQQQQLDAMQRQLAAQHAAIEEDRAKLEAERALELDVPVEDHSEEFEQLRSRAAELETQLAERQQAIDAQQQTAEGQIEAARRQAEAERVEMQSRFESLKADLDRSDAALAAAAAAAPVEDHTRELEELEQLRARTAELEAALTERRQAAESDRAEMQVRLDRLHAEVESRQADLERREAQLADAALVDQVNADAERIARERGELDRQRGAVEQQRGELAEMRTHLAAAAVRLLAFPDQQSPDEQPIDLDEAARMVEGQHDALRRRLSDLEEELVRRETVDADATALREELDAARREANAEREKAAALEAERSEMQGRLEQLQTSLDTRQSDLVRRETELNDRSEALTSAQEALDRRGEDLDRQSGELARSLTSLSEAAQTPEAEAGPTPEQMQSEVAIEADRLSRERQELERQQERLEGLRREWEASKHEFAERSESARRELMDRLDEAEAEIEFLQGEGAFETPPSVDVEEEPAAAPRRRQTTIDPFKLLRRHAAGIVAAGIIGGLLGYAAYLLLLEYRPMYTESVNFEVRSSMQEGDALFAADISKDSMVNRLASTETMLANGRDVLKRTLEGVEARQTQWHEQFLASDGSFMVEDAIDDLEKNVSPHIMRGSNLFSLQWKSPHPEDIQIVLNAIAKTYLEMREAQDNAVYNANEALFRAHVSETERDLENLEQEMHNFIRDKGITSLEDAQFTSSGIAAKGYATDRASLMMTYESLAATYDQVVARLEGWAEPTPSDLLMAENDPQLRTTMKTTLALKTEYRRVRDRYAPDHRIVQRVEQQLRAVEFERDAKINEVITLNLGAQRLALAAQMEQYESLVARTASESQRTAGEQQELAMAHARLAAMEKRREFLQLRRETILQLRKEVELMRMRADDSRVRIAKWAMTPREVSFPTKGTLVPAGAILMMGLVVGIVLLRELTDHRVKSASDLSVIPGANVIGVIPDLDDDPSNVESPDLVVRRHPNSVLAESYRQACSSIFATMEDNAAQLLMMTGGMPEAGTTTMVTNIAALAAISGKRVLVVDANFRRPRLAAALGVEEEGPGFGDLLAGETDLEEAIIDAGDGIHLIHAGTPANRIADRLNDIPVGTFAAVLRPRYDLIIIDTPPALAAGDALAIAERTDAAILVVRANQEHRGLVARLVRELDDTASEPLGILLNRPRRTAGGYFKKNYAAMASYAIEQPA